MDGEAERQTVNCSAKGTQMEIREFQSSIEAVLFASGEPVSAERLSDVSGWTRRPSTVWPEI